MYEDLAQFANTNWERYKTSITEASRSGEGKVLVESELQVYNFDEIAKSLFPHGDIPASADGLQFVEDKIQLIEFKSGFKQKITKENFDPQIGKCSKTDEVCEYYWSLFWENQDRKISELKDSIRSKAIESYILLEKHFLPNCQNTKLGKSNPLVFTVVIDEDGVDGIEDTLAEIAGSELDTNNSLFSIRKSLRRLLNRKDATGNSYFYDEIEVLTATDFTKRIERFT